MKEDVRAALARATARHAATERLSYVLKQITLLESEIKPEPLLRRFVLIMSALVHHQRHQGLTPRQVDGLARLAYASLQVCGVKACSSRLAHFN